MTKVAIIGAGLSGLTLARLLQPHADITVFEKARGVGGRMATRYAGDYEFDHGAQYFTVRTEAFKAFLQAKDLTETVALWPDTVEALNGARETSAEKYVATPRMNTLCKALASGVNVQLKTHIEPITQTDDGWVLKTKDGASLGTYDWVISTAPAPQTQALLPKDFSGQAALGQTVMQGCFSLMLGFENSIDLPWPAARSNSNKIGWMCTNSNKPGRSSHPSILIQSNNNWAEAHLENDPLEVQSALLKDASKLAGMDLSKAAHIALHRWRYAATPTPAGEAYLLDADKRLAACGDWCLGSKVEAAFTSGHELGQKLLYIFQGT